MLLEDCGSRLNRLDFEGSAFVGVGKPEKPGCSNVQRTFALWEVQER